MAHIRLEAALETSNKNSSLPNRIVHATKSFALSIFKRNDNDLRRSIAQRFEWYANGASEFLRFIELVKNLFACKELHHKIVQGNEYPLFQLWLTPIRNPVNGIDVSLTFTQYDATPEGNICFSLAVQLSESIDIVGIAVKCLQLFAPHFKCKFENIRNELTQLPNEDFSWGPPFYSDHKENWNKFNSLFSEFTRPNPFCCKEHGRHEVRRFSNMDMAGLSDDYPYLKAGIAFSPHGSLEDMLPANRCSEIAAIVRKEQHFLHTDITLEQLEDIMLPKAIDYFCQNAEAMVNQMLWKSKHGFALIQINMRRRSTFGGARKRKLFQGDGEELIRGRIRLCHWIDSWFTHVLVRLQRSLRN
ncbi:hypothetical protein SETIT_2G017200v2 [Setaria italica]|uniref:Uncharacterized protein n=1 Tax=Setaria italica TaxID=4555 RepID=A0A368PUH9_SETIT|nr:hypothetical protein SETIT_2G017200v2 [Setaria italica]